MDLNNLSPIAIFSNFIMTTSSDKHLKDISHAHVVHLMYKFLTSTKDSDDLSVEFDRDRARRPDELTSNKNKKGIYHVRS